MTWRTTTWYDVAARDVTQNAFPRVDCHGGPIYLQRALLAVACGERVLGRLACLAPPRKLAPRRAFAGEAVTEGNVHGGNRTLGRG